MTMNAIVEAFAPEIDADELPRYQRVLERAGALLITGRISHRWADIILGRDYADERELFSLMNLYENAGKQLDIAAPPRDSTW